MKKINLRAVKKYFHSTGLTPTETTAELNSISIVKNRVAKYKRGHTRTNNEPHTGRAKTATTQDVIEKVHRIMLNGYLVKAREIADIVNISILAEFLLKNWKWKISVR